MTNNNHLAPRKAVELGSLMHIRDKSNLRHLTATVTSHAIINDIRKALERLFSILIKNSPTQ